jgi:IS30 family transposase
MYSFSVSMVRRRISEAQRWQIIGMHTTGMSFKAIGRQMGYHYTVVSRLVRKHNHPLATSPVYMDDNARPHRSRAVTAYIQSEAVTSVPWPTMRPDLNPI